MTNLQATVDDQKTIINALDSQIKVLKITIDKSVHVHESIINNDISLNNNDNTESTANSTEIKLNLVNTKKHNQPNKQNANNNMVFSYGQMRYWTTKLKLIALLKSIYM
jgi:hypothetical protein